MNTKLTDFSPAEITTLLRALGEYKASLMNSIEIAKIYKLNHSSHKIELDNVELLIVQTMTAKNIIFNREVAQSN